jgi:predicted kinase
MVVVTGLPGAGKTTLGSALADALGAQFLSLDTIKERLYDTGLREPYQLRLAAEAELATELALAEGIVVVDIWVSPGRDTHRVADLFQRQHANVVEVLCRVPVEVAVERFVSRPRGGPHNPSDAATVQRIREAADRLMPLPIGTCLEVDTAHPVDIAVLAERVARLCAAW